MPIIEDRTSINILTREISMGFEDIFKHKEHAHHKNHGYDKGRRYDHHGHEGSFMQHFEGGRRTGHNRHKGGLEQYAYLFDKLKSNKKLLMILAVATIVMVILVIAAAIMLIPLIFKGFESIQTGGIKGLIETAISFLERLWSGTGN